MRGGLHAEMDADARRGVAFLKERRDFRRHRARHHARRQFDHIHLKPLGTGSGGEFQADEAGADHDDALARRDRLPQRFAFIQNSQVAHVRQIGVGDIEQAIARAGGQHQMPVVERRARCEHQLARGAIDRDGAIGRQFDVLVAVELVRPEHQAVGAALAFQIGLGQRRPLIGQMRLIVEQHDALGKAMLAQRRRELETRMAGADDQNWSACHLVRLVRREAAECPVRAACC